MNFEKLKREEEAAVEALYGKNSEAEEGTPTIEVDDDDFIEAPSTDNSSTEEASSDVDVQEKPETNDRQSWKKRFTSFKASADNTMFEQRKTIAFQNSKIASLSEEIRSLEDEIKNLKKELRGKVDQFKDVFTVEDEETIGPEAVEIIKKAMKAKEGGDSDVVKRLEAKLATIEKEKNEALKKDYESFKAKSLEDLKVKLSTQVKGWESIDTEPEFGEFIKGIDPISGSLRSMLFANAVENNDVYNVARFYKEYQSLKPKTKEQILAAKVTPVGNGSEGSAEVSEHKKIYSIQEYTQFMDELARGKWRNRAKEAKIKERQFDLAYSQGRLR